MADITELPTTGEIGGPSPRVLRLVLRYRSDDPYAVSLCFPGPAVLGGLTVEDGGEVEDGIQWTVGRDLLDEGTRAPAGSGDLLVRPEAPGRVRLDFLSAAGTATFRMAGADLRRFLDATQELVPLGTETAMIDWPRTADEFLSRIG